MDILLLLIPVAIVFVTLGLGIFFWAVKSGQFEDLDSPAHRILFDEDLPPTPGEQEDTSKHEP